MRRLLLGTLLAAGLPARAQTVGMLSVYEGQRILSVEFDLIGLPSEGAEAARIRQEVEAAFPVWPYTHFSRMQADFYLSRIRALPWVRDASLIIVVAGEGGLELTVAAHLMQPRKGERPPRSDDLFRDPASFPVIYASGNTFFTFRGALSEMTYGNADAWFGLPGPFVEGNPLADAPAGGGWSGWLEGYVMGGVYGVVRIVPRGNVHLYGGAGYIVAWSAGQELFTRSGRLRGGAEDAFVGIVGGGRTASGSDYSWNATFGRKSFVLGNGWLIVNTAMNGHARAALQLSPRWAARQLFQAGGRCGGFMAQFFRIRPDELPILDGRTVLEGLNAEWTPCPWVQVGAAVLHVPQSDVRYYLPDGVIRSRKGLWVYNLRLYGNPPSDRPGPFYKAEFGYQRNARFRMRALAGYLHAGWSFAGSHMRPTVGYRFAYFSGDDPHTTTYERWDALYTGGNGEQWVQGSNMYKLVQNSNETTHLVQCTFDPVRRWQVVGQAWAFIAPRRNNLGGNPALSYLNGRYYGTEFDLTVKYFRSARWYFHLSAGYTIPGNAVRRAVAARTRDWFSLMFFFRCTL